MSRLSRRRFVVGAGSVGLLAGCGRLPGQAPGQQPPRVYHVGFLAAGPNELATTPAPGTSPAFDGFRQGLGDHGYLEGQNLVIEYRSTAQGDQRLRELADELVRLPVDILVPAGGPGPSLAAKRVTG